MVKRHFFAGVNSPRGFFSRFSDIAADKECKRKIYIKGGSGMGKSTIMKKIAQKADVEGFSVDYFHCSSDPNSLDGVYIDGLKTAVIDATAPHNSDPAYPGATGEIFNCADFLDSEKVRENKEEIFELADRKKRALSRAYKYMRAASDVLDDITDSYKNTMYAHGIDLEAEKLIRRYLPEIIMPKPGSLRRLFVSAVTADGFENYMDTVFDTRNVITVKGGCGTDILLKKIADASLSRGFSVEAFYCPMSPENKLEHIVINDIKAVFTTYNHNHHYLGNDTVDLDEYLTQMPLETDGAYSLANSLLEQATTSLGEARAAHSFLENFYTPAMDFDGLEKHSNILINSIFI